MKRVREGPLKPSKQSLNDLPTEIILKELTRDMSDATILLLSWVNKRLSTILSPMRNGIVGWKEEVCAYAAEHGLMNIITWTREHDFFYADICYAAAWRGHVDMLELAISAGGKWDPLACSNAVYMNKLNILKWAHDKRLNLDEVIYNTCVHGRLEILKWAVESGFRYSKKSMQYTASGNGHLEILQYLALKDGLRKPWIIGYFAARSGHIEILKWLHANGYSLPRACAYAAIYGHLDALKWLYENGHPLDGPVFEMENLGHPEITEWIKEHRDPCVKL
jgi:hypothetical protein